MKREICFIIDELLNNSEQLHIWCTMKHIYSLGVGVNQQKLFWNFELIIFDGVLAL